MVTYYRAWSGKHSGPWWPRGSTVKVIRWGTLCRGTPVEELCVGDLGTADDQADPVLGMLQLLPITRIETKD